MTQTFPQADMETRLVRYAALRPCTRAFIDSRTPGSERKENFTIIGPGVSENPEQFVHIKIPHGFNLGGARQPPGCVNSQHSHDTAEVFVVHSGRWRFKTGHDGRGPSIDLESGDTISIPTRVFRGFENIGEDVGFMFAVLGGDNPGHVTWAPYVFEAAHRHGMVLLETGRLIDTTVETIPADAKPLTPTRPEDLTRFDTVDAAKLQGCVVRAGAAGAGGGLSTVAGFSDAPVIGQGNAAAGIPPGPIDWPHGFHLDAVTIAAGASCPSHRRPNEEVLWVHSGHPWIEWSGGRLDLGPGDTLSIPAGLAHRYGAIGSATLFMVHGGDHPSAPRWVSS